jgi:hypothetical protein
MTYAPGMPRFATLGHAARPNAGRFLVAIALLGALIVGCDPGRAWAPDGAAPAFGPVRSEADAIAAARVLTEFAPPLQILRVQHGIAQSLYTGVYGSSTDEGQAKEQLARRQRSADPRCWRCRLVLAPRRGRVAAAWA